MIRYIGVFIREIKMPEGASAAIDWGRHCCDNFAKHGLGTDQYRFRSFGRPARRGRLDDVAAGIIPPRNLLRDMRQFVAAGAMP